MMYSTEHDQGISNEHEPLEVLVNEYLEECSRDHLSDLESFYDLEGDGRTLFGAATARNRAGKKHPHQRRISKATLEAGASALQAHIDELRSCTSFDQLHTLVRIVVEGKRGLGPLYIYDTALRYGFSKGLLPEKVYLHRGTLLGAERLGLETKAATLSLDELPSELAILSPMDIEDFLCRYKKRF